MKNSTINLQKSSSLTIYSLVCALSIWTFCAIPTRAFATVSTDAVEQSPAPAKVEKVKITGTVLDEEKNPIVGASVFVKGTTQGATTNTAGKFTIMAKPRDVLVCTMLGFIAKEVPIANRIVHTINMEPDVKQIEDIVVSIGYGEQRLKDVTGTLASVNVNDMAKAPVVSFDQALAGRIAGVQVSSADGQPGAAMDIVIRGTNSLTQSNSPLYVIDGFPMEDFSSSAINPADIGSITILKDASATAIYGSRGANGVVIIETKKGKAGTPVVSYNGSYGIQKASNTMELMDAYEYVKFAIEFKPDPNIENFLTKPGKTLDDYRNYKGLDMQKGLLRTAPINNHSISMTGGSAKTQYAASGSYVNQEGVIVNSGYTKYQGRISVDQTVNKKVKIGLSLNYTEDKNTGQISASETGPNNGLMYRAWSFPGVVLKGMIMDDIPVDEDEEVGTNRVDPISSSNNEIINTRRSTMIANVKINYSILPSLRLNVRAGYTKRKTANEAFYNTKTYRGYPSPNNAANGVNGSQSDATTATWMNENTLTYSKKFNKKHEVNATVGLTLEQTKSTLFGFNAIQIPDEKLGISGMDEGTAKSITSRLSENALISYLGRINYNYDSRYMFTASFRSDGSSKFAKKNRWGYFPSAALAWNMSNEQFMKSQKVVTNAKLRLSYGVTGNNRIGDFSQYSSLIKNNYWSFNNETPIISTKFNAMGNPDMKWESTEQINLGYDLGLLNDRVNLTFDIYRKTTKDLLLNADMPYTSGVVKAYKNIGSIRNDGLELSLNTVNIRTKNFLWTSDFNISFNKNKILKLAEGQNNMLSSVAFWSYFDKTNLYIANIGGPAASFFGIEWDGVYQYSDFNKTPGGTYILKSTVPDNGTARDKVQPGDIKYVDKNGDGTINNEDMVIIGRCTPIHSGGFNNNFEYKNFSLNLFFQWSYGNDIMNANRIVMEGDFRGRIINQFASYADRWSPENQDSKNYRAGGYGPAGIYSSRTIEDGSFLRLKTAQFAYSLPKSVLKRVNIKDITVYVAGQNLFTWTNYSGMDPEVSVRHSTLTPGYDYSAYARNRIFTLGLKVTF